MWSSAKPLQLLPPTSAPAAPKTWLWGRGRTNAGLLPAGAGAPGTCGTGGQSLPIPAPSLPPSRAGASTTQQHEVQQPASSPCDSRSQKEHDEGSRSSLTEHQLLPSSHLSGTHPARAAGRQGTLPVSLCAPGAGASAAVCSAQHHLHGSRWGFLEHLTLQYQSDQSHVARLPFLSYNQ